MGRLRAVRIWRGRKKCRDKCDLGSGHTTSPAALLDQPLSSVLLSIVCRRISTIASNQDISVESAPPTDAGFHYILQLIFIVITALKVLPSVFWLNDA